MGRVVDKSIVSGGVKNNSGRLPVQYNMTYQIVRLMFLAGLAFAAPGLERVKRGYGGSGSGASAGSFASSSSSSSAGGGGGAGGIACAFIGHTGGGYSGSGGNSGGSDYNSRPNTGGASAISSSGAGSLGGGGGSYGKPASYGVNSANTIPYGGGNAGGGGYGGGNAGGGGYGGGYASGFPSGSYGGGGGPGFGGSGGGFPFNLPGGCVPGFQNFGPDPYQIQQEIMNNLKRLHEENLRFGAPSGGTTGSQGGGGSVGSFASGNIGPEGGTGYAGVYPSGGLGVRFGDAAPPGSAVQSTSGNIPPPTGDFYGISTSSQAGSSNVDGQTKSFKKSQVTVNDGGKVTSYSASDP